MQPGRGAPPTRATAAVLAALAGGALAGCSGRGAAPGEVDAGAATTATAPASAAAPVVSAATAPTPPPPDPAACSSSPDLGIFLSPAVALAGRPLRAMAVAERKQEGVLTVFAPDGSIAAQAKERRGGPPYWWSVEVPSPSAGVWRAVLSGGAGGAPACRSVTVSDEAPPPAKRRGRWSSAWPVHAAWGRATENLYSAWIDKLFDAPLEEQPTWPALHDVLRDPKRNFLHDHLGLDEDEPAKNLVVDPDCADLPYFLRAYFGFKMGLPVGYSGCTRGGGGNPPRCVRWHSSVSAGGKRGDPVRRFGDFLRVTLADTVHSGTGRTPAADDATDYYPVALSPETLRPGTIYADPYGHVLVIARRLEQTADSGGVLLAVDGQPDGTIARRRFWRGNFLFADDPALGSPGFKRFRPVVVDGGLARALTNDEVKQSPDYGDYSLEQYAGGVEGFYDMMDDVLSPSPIDPARAFRETIQALDEQVRGRLLSVANGEKFVSGGGGVVDMPEGPSIFETTGPWEDFATPSRDLRLLVAVDIVRGFPDRVARRPGRYAMPAGKSAGEVKGELERLLAGEAAARKFTYTRSDGTPFEITLADVIARARDLEMAYNPNDCIELRWGAPPKSAEAATCRRRAPADQRARMSAVRAWFHERRRPPRG